VQGAKWWLVCYDVRDPERLRRAAKHMEGYGERMQYSVFLSVGAQNQPARGASKPATMRRFRNDR
jgi:CRISPR-associated endonuclease Cas2